MYLEDYGHHLKVQRINMHGYVFPIKMPQLVSMLDHLGNRDRTWLFQLMWHGKCYEIVNLSYSSVSKTYILSTQSIGEGQGIHVLRDLAKYQDKQSAYRKISKYIKDRQETFQRRRNDRR